MTVDTVFLCYCEDYEENNGTTKPYFMSPKLMKVMRKLNGNPDNKYGENYNQPYPDQQNYPMDQFPQQPDAFNYYAQNTSPIHDITMKPFISQPSNDFIQPPYPQHPSPYDSNMQNQYSPQRPGSFYANDQNQYPPQNEAYPTMPNYIDQQQPIGFSPQQFDQTALPYSPSSSIYPPQNYASNQQMFNPPQALYPPQAPYNSYT